MSIKRFFICFAIFILLVTIVIAGSLVAFTTKMNTLTSQLADSVESVRASEEIQLELLLHRQATGRQTTAVEPSGVSFFQREKTIAALIEIAKSHINTEEERTLVIELEKAVGEYFLIWSQGLGSTEIPSSAIVKLAFDESFRLADLVTESNVSYAAEIQKQSQDASRLATVLAVVFSILCIGSLAMIWIAMRVWIYRPVKHLSQMIRNYSTAEKRISAVFRGPTELKTVADSFLDLSTRLNQQRQDQLRFLASVAHDLRNPLGAIRMSGELLGDPEEIPAVERRPMVDLINRQIELLNRMVGDLLDSTRIESGNLEICPQKEDITSLVGDAVSLHRPLSAVHQIEFIKPPRKVFCICDRLRVTQVLNNLFSNAIKYSPNGGLIKISLEVTGRFALIQISDSGIGISNDDQEKIFLPFHRTQLTKETIPGIGLGLSVTKKIIEAHNGMIELDSNPGTGSTFRVKIPLWNSETELTWFYNFRES